jgi:hypothetical protein
MKWLLIILAIIAMIIIVVVVIIIVKSMKNNNNNSNTLVVRSKTNSLTNPTPIGNSYELLGTTRTINYIDTDLVDSGFVYCGNSRFPSNSRTEALVQSKIAAGGFGVETNNIYPTSFTSQWMYLSKDVTTGTDPSGKYTGVALGDRPLNRILIPGSHDTMTYYIPQPGTKPATKVPYYGTPDNIHIGPDIIPLLLSVDSGELLPDITDAIVLAGPTAGWVVIGYISALLSLIPIIGPILAIILSAAYVVLIAVTGSMLLQPGIGKAITALWARAQGNSITDQLNMGIRYLDLRLCVDTINGTKLTGLTINDITFTHSLIASNCTFPQFITEMNTWIQANPHELVILDFQYLLNVCYDQSYISPGNVPQQSSGALQYGLLAEDQIPLQIAILNLIHSTWGNKIAPASFTLSNTYNAFLQNGYNFVIMFDNGGTKQQFPNNPNTAPGDNINGNTVVASTPIRNPNNPNVPIVNPNHYTFATFWSKWLDSDGNLPYYWARERDNTNQSGTLCVGYNADSSPIDFYNCATSSSGYQRYTPPISLPNYNTNITYGYPSTIFKYGNIILSNTDLTKPQNFYIESIVNGTSTTIILSNVLLSGYNSKTFNILINGVTVVSSYTYIENVPISFTLSNVLLNSQNSIQFTSSTPNFILSCKSLTLNITSSNNEYEEEITSSNVTISSHSINNIKYYSLIINSVNNMYSSPYINFSVPSTFIGHHFTSGSIDYTIDCQSPSTSQFNILLNNVNIYSATPISCHPQNDNLSLTNTSIILSNRLLTQFNGYLAAFTNLTITLNTDIPYVSPSGTDLVILGCTVGIPADTTMETISALAYGLFDPIPLNHGNGLLQQSQNWSPVMINNFLGPYNRNLFYYNSDFPLAITPPVSIGTHNIFLHDNVCKFNVCTLLIAANRGELDIYNPPLNPTTSDSQCNYDGPNKCKADDGYDPKTCTQYRSQCFSTSAVQCMVDSDCSYDFGGSSCKSGSGKSNLYCRLSNGAHQCTCANPSALAPQCTSDADCGYGSAQGEFGAQSYSRNKNAGSYNCRQNTGAPYSYCSTPYYDCKNNDQCNYSGGVCKSDTPASYKCKYHVGGCQCDREADPSAAAYDPTNYNNVPGYLPFLTIFYIYHATFCGNSNIYTGYTVKQKLTELSTSSSTGGYLTLDTSKFTDYFLGICDIPELNIWFSFTDPISRTISTTGNLSMTSPIIPFQNTSYNIQSLGMKIISATFSYPGSTSINVTNILQNKCIFNTSTIIQDGISYYIGYTTLNINVAEYTDFDPNYEGVGTLNFTYIDQYQLSIMGTINSNIITLSYKDLSALASFPIPPITTPPPPPLLNRLTYPYKQFNNKNNFIIAQSKKYRFPSLANILNQEQVNSYILFDDISINNVDNVNTSNLTCSVVINVVDNGNIISSNTITDIPYPSNNIIQRIYLNSNFIYQLTKTSILEINVNIIGTNDFSSRIKNGFAINTSNCHFKFNYYPPTFKISFLDATYGNVNVLPLLVAKYYRECGINIAPGQYGNVFPNIITLPNAILQITYEYNNIIYNEVYTQSDNCIISEFSLLNIRSASYHCTSVSNSINVTSQIVELLRNSQYRTLIIDPGTYHIKYDVSRLEACNSVTTYFFNYGIGSYHEYSISELNKLDLRASNYHPQNSIYIDSANYGCTTCSNNVTQSLQNIFNPDNQNIKIISGEYEKYFPNSCPSYIPSLLSFVFSFGEIIEAQTINYHEISISMPSGFPNKSLGIKNPLIKIYNATYRCSSKSIDVTTNLQNYIINQGGTSFTIPAYEYESVLGITDICIGEAKILSFTYIRSYTIDIPNTYDLNLSYSNAMIPSNIPAPIMPKTALVCGSSVSLPGICINTVGPNTNIIKGVNNGIANINMNFNLNSPFNYAYILSSNAADEKNNINIKFRYAIVLNKSGIQKASKDNEKSVFFMQYSLKATNPDGSTLEVLTNTSITSLFSTPNNALKYENVDKITNFNVSKCSKKLYNGCNMVLILTFNVGNDTSVYTAKVDNISVSFNNIYYPINPSLLTIINASYGNDSCPVFNSPPRDVTQLIQSKVVNNTLNFTVNNDTLRGDSCSGYPKVLKVNYSYASLNHDITVNEGENINI